MTRPTPSEPAVTRRRAMQLLGLSVVGLAGAGCRRPAAGPPSLPIHAAEDGLDEAYRLVHQQEPESKQGLSTHAPMVAEALARLGHADRSVAWVEKYDAPVRRLPPPTARIDPSAWRQALGPRHDAETWEAANARWADWKELFTAELAEAPWHDVLDRWVARLAPGMSGAATHGVIRTGHAARALGHREGPERLAELARGLAYWASSYEELPARRTNATPVATFAQGLARVPLHWEAFGHRPEGRNIVEALRGVHKLERFAAVRDLVAPPDDLSAGLSALTAAFTRVYLRHGTRNDTIAFVHAVTGPASLRRLAPHVKPQTARAALPYAWQTAAAVYAAYARPGEKLAEPGAGGTPEELVERALKSGDEHAIKFTEVMVAEHALSPDPAYLAAAADAIGRL